MRCSYVWYYTTSVSKTAAAILFVIVALGQITGSVAPIRPARITQGTAS